MHDEGANKVMGWMLLIAVVAVPILWWWVKARIQAGMTGRAVERERRRGRNRYRDEEDE